MIVGLRHDHRTPSHEIPHADTAGECRIGVGQLARRTNWVPVLFWCYAGTMATVNLNLRLPPDLHAALVELAGREDRSLNAQIVRLLRQCIEEANRS
jgi:hypothetical protein